MNKFHFKNLAGHVIQHYDCIFPIMIQKGDIHEAIATGFYISTNGIFITARHALGSDEQNYHPYIIHCPNEKEFLIRPIIKIIHKNNSDLAIGLAAEIKNNKTNLLMANKIMALTLQSPEINEEVVSYAYPSTEVHSKKPTKIFMKPDFSPGKITKSYPTGRDKVMLPTRCWETNMCILGGTSGGPVCNKRGFVFAINSTGFNNEPISFISSIEPVLEIDLGDVSTPNGILRNCTIKKLVELDYIHVE